MFQSLLMDLSYLSFIVHRKLVHCTVVNWRCTFINRRSLDIKRTLPLKTILVFLLFANYDNYTGKGTIVKMVVF